MKGCEICRSIDMLEAQPRANSDGDPRVWVDQDPSVAPHVIGLDLSGGYGDVVMLTRLTVDDAERLALDLLAAVGAARRGEP